MKQEDKELLLRDLCARLPYNVLVHIYDIDVCDYDNYLCEDDLAKFRINSIQIKPYLRPMSSMTEEEYEEYYNISYGMNNIGSKYNYYDLCDWFNKHHIDYRDLIDKGLAIEAPEGMYNNKN